MKILHGDSRAKDGIHFVCKWCNCEYVVEDRNDWTIYPVYDFDPETGLYDRNHEINEYSVICPNCKYQTFLGINYQESKYENPPRYEWIFDREDWNERFAILVDDNTKINDLI